MFLVFHTPQRSRCLENIALSWLSADDNIFKYPMAKAFINIFLAIYWSLLTPQKLLKNIFVFSCP